MKYELKEIKISTLDASIYIEQLGHQEEDDRIKIYDSDKEYLEYRYVENLADIIKKFDNVEEVSDKEIQEFLDAIADNISKLTTIDNVLFAVGVESYTTAHKGDLSPILAELFNGDLQGYEQAEKWGYGKQLAYIKETGYANRIGDYIVLNTEDF